MARNIEIKARIAGIEALLPAVLAVATEGPREIRQDDSFFRCANGRLKLRDFGDGRGELIFYQRADQAGPKTSHYVITPTADPAGLRSALRQAWGETGRVRKRRTLVLAGRTRIHLDEVEGLGAFLELEVVLADGEAAETGEREAHDLMRQLGIAPADLVEGAYVDLLVSAAAGPAGGG
ncbi:class IV adenylate cyclase [Ideonella sp.]|uniref:class IV adenylate cyclase n=1 Tax=Ideonella sp. TaxID=1929293 RepID=UPI002B47A37F|nr:class IV adenylate cyclase [Ideonella sp.]HJV68694.1 class IV adenylate cyclase [Ideonella sp.]